MRVMDPDLAELLAGALRTVLYAGFVLLAGTLAFWTLVWPDGRYNRRQLLLVDAGLAVLAVGTLLVPVVAVVTTGRAPLDALSREGWVAVLLRLAVLVAVWAFLSELVDAPIRGRRRLATGGAVVVLTVDDGARLGRRGCRPCVAVGRDVLRPPARDGDVARWAAGPRRRHPAPSAADRPRGADPRALPGLTGLHRHPRRHGCGAGGRAHRRRERARRPAPTVSSCSSRSPSSSACSCSPCRSAVAPTRSCSAASTSRPPRPAPRRSPCSWVPSSRRRRPCSWRRLPSSRWRRSRAPSVLCVAGHRADTDATDAAASSSIHACTWVDSSMGRPVAGSPGRRRTGSGDHTDTAPVVVAAAEVASAPERVRRRRDESGGGLPCTPGRGRRSSRRARGSDRGCP